jgi:hypothetical protein
MIPGHPFLTEELDNHRAKQRAILSSLPLAALERMVPHPLSAELLPTLHERTESALREIAVRYVEEAHQLVADAHLVAVADAALAAVDATPAAGADDLNELRQQLEHHRVFPKVVELHYNDEVLSALRVLVPLLVWADEIAADYTDPRIPDARATQAAHAPDED